MKKIGKIFFAVIVMLIALNVVNKAEAAETEPLISVKLSNYLGNKSSITIQPSEIYRIKGTNLILNAKKDYEVKVTSSDIAIYKGTEKLAEFSSFEVTPSTYDATLSIQGRKYLGDVAFTNESQKYVRPINTLPIEDYLKGVVPEESLKNWTSLNTFKAQAVAARSYALKHLNDSNLTDTQSRQVYGGKQELSITPLTDQAVEETFGEVVTYNGRVVETLFSSSNGGIIESNSNYWTNSAPLPYFQVKNDPYDPQMPWKKVVNKQQIDLSTKDLAASDTWWSQTNEKDLKMADNIKNKMKANGLDTKDIKITDITKIDFYDRASGQRVTKGDLSVRYIKKDDVDKDGKILIHDWDYIGESAKTVKDLIEGSSMLNLYVTSIDEGDTSFTIRGKGFGHGVGMSQQGSNVMANQGMDYKEILAFYYPGTALTEYYSTKAERSYKTAPYAAALNSINETDTKITGKAEANTLVYVKFNSTSSAITARGKADSDGNFSVSIPKQAAGTKIYVILKNDVNYSPYASTVVKAIAAPKNPAVNELKETDTAVKGTTEANALVYIKFGSTSGQIEARGKADAKGNFTVAIPAQASGTKVYVIAKNAVKYSKYTSVTVKAYPAPAAPVLNAVTEADTVLSGKAEANTTVYVKLDSSKNSTSFRGKTNAKGSFSISIPKQNAGRKMYVIVKNTVKYSSYSSVTVQAKQAPKAPTINSVTRTSTAVSGKAAAGALVYVKAGSSKSSIIGRGKVDARGTYKVSISSQPTGTRMYLIIKADGVYSPYAWTTVR
ncbi:SpoIID/LytB domain-containing protein [Priestia aryabhattai]|uniref:SpoIID/LytB domain-containing protein n=1 Tax=Priestia aryabhattai TaxID=412384 RepID=UPI0023AEA194|nr:SpoIID/LytB domain-containing protein [Priestia aryabhattai]MDE8675371.1 SpoIID/LytB domain-containing protein [Priestia aryabhattai]